MDFTRKRHRFTLEIKQKISKLRELDNWHAPLALLYDFGVISLAVWLFCLNVWFYLPSIILIGSRQRALATILHESAHRCIAKSKFLNYVFGTFFSGYLIFQEYYSYRDSHVKKHHAYLGDKENDPDYQYHIEQKLYQSHDMLGFLVAYFIKPLLLLKSGSYFKYLLKNRLFPSRQYLKYSFIMLIYWVFILTMSCYFGVFHLVILLWFIPLITTANVVGWFNELAEHFPLVALNNEDLHMTRNRSSHFIEHYLCNMHNEHFHLVHHLFPNIPFWNLPKAHRILCQDKMYADWNKLMGGIFVSNNNNPSLLSQLLSSFPRVTQGLKQ